MTAYFGLWGMNASAAEAFKEAPYTMVVTLKVQILNNQYRHMNIAWV